MREKLKRDDIKRLRNQCIPGLIVGILLFSILSFVLLAFFLNSNDVLIINVIITFVTIFLSSFIIAYIMTHKYLTDIRNREKKLIFKTVQAKEYKEEYKADSSTAWQSSNKQHNN